MRRRTLTDLASNPDLISGIYNYCDRWCERCPLTSRCLVFATEQVDHKDAPESHDVRNEAFWHRLSSILNETQEIISEWASEAGIDLNHLPDEEARTRKRRRPLVDSHPLTRAGKKYANAASDWFREFDGTIESARAGKHSCIQRHAAIERSIPINATFAEPSESFGKSINDGSSSHPSLRHESARMIFTAI